eukprot:NODE_4021_length_849_cov_37.743750_g3333_i0.p2 GENE.NODE_4021_length_849_cov_37.743750_g3333_i0~~NODE_4021_length_849_cov_37.743750_g3333_i0.p2  ORF type:complete len:152 (+),score=52.41 NODE_4021_length_849_cov_37.743750_g3333_i0:332-787(+)
MTNYKAKARPTPPSSAARRKVRKAHFTAPSHVRRIIMSAPLSKDLQKKLGIRRLPIRKEDEVRVKRGTHACRDGKVIKCYRKRWTIHVDKVNEVKLSGATYYHGIHPSNVEITKVKMDKCRKALIDRRNRSKSDEGVQKRLAKSNAAGDVD